MELLHARSSVVTAAKAYGLAAIDMVSLQRSGRSSVMGSF